MSQVISMTRAQYMLFKLIIDDRSSDFPIFIENTTTKKILTNKNIVIIPIKRLKLVIELSVHSFKG